MGTEFLGRAMRAAFCAFAAAAVGAGAQTIPLREQSIAGVRLGMTPAEVERVMRVRYPKARPLALRRPCLSEYVAALRRHAQGYVQGGSCVVQSVAKDAQTTLDVVFAEQLPERPGATRAVWIYFEDRTLTAPADFKRWSGRVGERFGKANSGDANEGLYCEPAPEADYPDDCRGWVVNPYVPPAPHWQMGVAHRPADVVLWYRTGSLTLVDGGDASRWASAFDAVVKRVSTPGGAPF